MPDAVDRLCRMIADLEDSEPTGVDDVSLHIQANYRIKALSLRQALCVVAGLPSQDGLSWDEEGLYAATDGLVDGWRVANGRVQVADSGQAMATFVREMTAPVAVSVPMGAPRRLLDVLVAAEDEIWGVAFSDVDRYGLPRYPEGTVSGDGRLLGLYQALCAVMGWAQDDAVSASGDAARMVRAWRRYRDLGPVGR